MKTEKKIKIFSAIFIIILVLMLIFNRALLSLKKSIDRFFLPIQIKIYTLSEKIGDFKKFIFSYSDILKENEDLRKKNEELKIINRMNENILEENKKLVNLLEMKEKNKDIKNLKFARVIYKDINDINSRFFIDLGEKDEIQKNMIVTYNQILIGRIKEVFDNYSVVSMITSSTSNISVRTSNGVLGVVQGVEEENGEMWFLPSTFEENLELGEEIFTSGISDIYPRGLKVGEIIEIDKTENNFFKKIKIKSQFNSAELREVMVYKYIEQLEKKVK